jgi:adenosylcobinamide-GDP ribazoletransferase
MPLLRLFLSAVAFLTRFPVPNWAHPDADGLARAMCVFPLVGALLGVVNAGAAWALWHVVPRDITALVLVALPVLMTGALHHDGLADTVDAVGGGFTRERRLAIMKDPHIGTYGVISVVLLILAQFSIFKNFPNERRLCLALVAAPALARVPTVLLPFWLNYARAEGGKGKFVEKLRGWQVIVAFLLALAVAYACLGVTGFYAAGAMLVICGVAGRYFQSSLGGITGDTLGATSIVSETVILGMLSFL